MKKTLWLVLVLVFACILLLSACDQATDHPPNPDAEQSTNQPPDNNSGTSDADNTQSSSTDSTKCQHAFGEWVTTKDATCTLVGEQERICFCGEKEVKSLAIIPHTEVVDQAVAATCTKTGLTEGKHCSICNTVTIAQTTVKAKGHTEVVDQAVAATCTKTGLTEGKHCSVCNIVTIAQTTVPVTHQYEDATCDEPMKCAQCGQTYGLAEGHSFNGSYCSSCGGYLYDIFNYTYSSGSSIIGDRNYTYGTATITGCSKTYYKYPFAQARQGSVCLPDGRVDRAP